MMIALLDVPLREDTYTNPTYFDSKSYIICNLSISFNYRTQITKIFTFWYPVVCQTSHQQRKCEKTCDDRNTKSYFFSEPILFFPSFFLFFFLIKLFFQENQYDMRSKLMKKDFLNRISTSISFYQFDQLGNIKKKWHKNVTKLLSIK